MRGPEAFRLRADRRTPRRAPPDGAGSQARLRRRPGPNTGGMGAFAPSPLVDDELLDRIRDTIILPVIEGMRAEGREFRGFLYAGLMLTADGPKVVEFNVRLGDPEAQVVLPMIDGDLGAAAAGCRGREARAGHLSGARLAARRRRARVEGLPGQRRDGQGDHRARRGGGVPGVTVFHAGTARRDGEIVTAGGRVLTVVGEGRTSARRSRAPTRPRAASTSTGCSAEGTSAGRRSALSLGD